jgi:hypothetical protein
LAHERNGRLRDVDDPEQIRFDLGTDVLMTRILDRADVTVSSVVHQHIEPAEGPNGRLDGVACRLRVGNVEGARADLITVPLYQIRELGRVARGGNELVAHRKHRFRECPAQSPRTPCNQPDFGHRTPLVRLSGSRHVDPKRGSRHEIAE